MSMGLFHWLLLSPVLLFGLQYYLIVLYEEKYLEQTFGTQYVSYRKHVNRFLPRWIPGRSGTRPLFITRGFASDRRTLQAEGIVTALFLVLYLLHVGA